MATHSSTPARRIPRTEGPGRLQPMGLHRVGHDGSDLACMHYFEVFLVFIPKQSSTFTLRTVFYLLVSFTSSVWLH